MELTDNRAHRALLYVASVQRQGHALSVAEFEAYMARPFAYPDRPEGPPKRVPITGTLFESLVRSQRSIQGYLERSLFTTFPGEPGEPGESTLAWLTRLMWLSVDADRVTITPLGKAVLSHLEQASLDEDIPAAIVLDQGDPLATPRVIGQIADLGSAGLIDPYFSIDHLLQILQSTKVEAVLTGDRGDAKRIPELRTALPALEPDRKFEIRISNTFHDRFVVPTSGSVWLIGTSLTGIGKRLSLMVELKDEAVSGAIRRRFETEWESAEPVVTAPPAESPDRPEPDAREGGAESADSP